MTDQNARLRSAANRLRSINDEIEASEERLERLEETRKHLERVELPDLFSEAGIKSLTLEDGSIIKLSTMAEGSLPKEPDKRQEAIDWLVAHGYENLIECKVVGSWARGERAVAQAEYERLRARGDAKVAFDENIHHATLGARMRDRVVAGLATPLMTLGVTVFDRARFTKTTRNHNDE